MLPILYLANCIKVIISISYFSNIFSMNSYYIEVQYYYFIHLQYLLCFWIFDHTYYKTSDLCTITKLSLISHHSSLQHSSFDSVHYTITRRRRSTSRRSSGGTGDYYPKAVKVVRLDQRPEGIEVTASGGEDSEYEVEDANGYVQETPDRRRKFNPWNADIHYGLMSNPAERG